MIRRGKGFFNFGSRNNRRAQQAQLRANRSNHRWMSIFRQRQQRLARWRKAFRPFVPLNMRRFQAIWMAFTGLLAGLINTVSTSNRPTPLMANRAGMVRWGGKKKSNRRRKRSTIHGPSRVSYEALEDRKLLAVDITSIAGDNLINAVEQSDVIVVGNGATPGGNVSISVFGVPGTTTVMADAAGNFTTAGSGLDVSGVVDGVLSFTALDVTTSDVDTAGATKDTVAPTLSPVDLDSASDSGVSDTDNITNITTPTFQFIAELDSTVDFSFDGTTFSAPIAATGASQTFTPGSPLADGPQAITVRSTDSAGNITTQSLPFTIDTDADVGGDLEVEIVDGGDGINDSEAASTGFSVTGLDTDATAVVEFTDGTTTISVPISSNTTGSQDLSSLADVLITASITATDIAGNTATVDPSDTSRKDTVSPTATVSFSDTFLDESDTSVVLTIIFSEPVNPAVLPIISFPQSETSLTLTSPSSAGFISSTEFQVTYVVADVDVELSDIQIDVSGVQDLAGNVMIPLINQGTGTAIDTLVEQVSFIVNDPDPQEDVLPSTTTVQAQVVFFLDQATDEDTTISFRVADGGANPDATAGVDFVVPDPDGSGPGTSVLTPGEFNGTIIIPAGQTSVQLDIDIVPDLILEGDEDFTVSVTGAAIAGGEAVEVVPAASTGVAVTIEDNETGANVTLDVVDAHAAEGPLDFPAIDLAGVSVLTDGGGATRTTPQGVVDVFFIDVFDNEYDEVLITGTAGGTDAGDASVSVRFFYTDGSIVAAPSVVFPSGAVDFTGSFAADPNLILDHIEISVNTNDIPENGDDGGDFVFSGASGIFKGDNTGLFRLSLDTELTADLQVTIDTSTGEAVAGQSTAVPNDGVDYYLSAETFEGSGAFTPLTVSSSGLVTVIIPAGSQFIDLQLTTIEDWVIEGGIVDSPGIEDARLNIVDTGPNSFPTNVVTFDNTDFETVKIEDNDFGTVRIEATDPDASEPGTNTGEFEVFLEKTGSATETGNPATSSHDVLANVAIGGDATFGTDFITTFTADPGTSIATAQPIGGFFSVASGSTVAQNTVRRSAGLAQEDFYQIELFNSGQVNLSTVSPGSFDPIVTLFNANGGFVARNDNGGPGNDASLTVNLTPGVYFIQVQDANGTSALGDNGPLSSSDSYLLNVSIENLFSTSPIGGSFDGGVRIPAGEESTRFNIEPLDDAILEGGTDESPGSEATTFTLTGFSHVDSDIDLLTGETADTVVIVDDDSAVLDLRVLANPIGDEDPLPSPPTDDAINPIYRVELTPGSSIVSSIDTTVEFEIVNFNTAAGVPGVEQVGNNATFGIDYTLSTRFAGRVLTFDSVTGRGTLLIPAGERNADIIVNVINEDIIEDQESVQIRLVGNIDNTDGSDPSTFNSGDWDITIDNGVNTVVINDEDQSNVTVDGTAFAEEGGQRGVFTVSLDSPHVSDSNTDVEFQLIFPSGTAPSTVLSDIFDVTGADVIAYDPLTQIGVVRIGAFTPSAEIEVVATDDALIEDTEFVQLQLLGIFNNQADSNISVSTDPADAATITDVIEVRDNDQAYVRITAVQDGSEPGGGSNNGQFRVDLVDSSGSLVTTAIDILVSYDVLNTSTAANGAAANDGVNADYLQLDGAVTITAGSSGADIDVIVFDDFLRPTNESVETVDLLLTGTDALLTQAVVSADSADIEATVEIADDDAIEVTISASDPYAREANDDGQFAVSLSGFSDAPVEVDLGVLLGNGPNIDATLGSDFSLSGTVVTFAPGELVQFVDLNVINDAELEEFIEQAEVEVNSIISANTGVSLQGDSAIVKIHPDPTVQIQALDRVGSEGGSDASFIVHLPFVQDAGGPVFDATSPTAAIGQPYQIGTADGDLTVTYEVRGDAVNGDDFAVLTGTVTIPAADGYAIIDVDITDDNIIEDLEFVSVILKDVTAADANDADVEVRKDLFSIDSSSNALRIINTDVSDGVDDGTTDSIVALVLEDGTAVTGATGLASNPLTHEVFAVVSIGGDTTNRTLVTVDPATGIAQLVGELESSLAVGDDFRSIAFDNAGALFGITNLGGLFAINTSDAGLTFVGALGDDGAAVYGDSLSFTPDGELFHGNNTFFENGAGVPFSGAISDVNALEHAQNGNFANNAFFSVDINGATTGGGGGGPANILNLLTFNDSTPGPDVIETFVGFLDHAAEDIAFIKSNAYVQILDNDAGFVEVKPKADGADNLNDDVDTGFSITLRGPDGTTATTSDTATTVAFQLDNEATPFLGAQTAAGTPFQDIDGFPGGSLGGSLFFSPNTDGTPHTIINGEDNATYTFTFTVLNDGDQVDIGFDLGSGTIELFEGVSDLAADSLGIPSSVISTGLDAGTYTIRVVVDDTSILTTDEFSLNVAIENHLIADYQLTSDAINNLTPVDIAAGQFEVTIPALTETVWVTVDVFNDTQVEAVLLEDGTVDRTEEISLYLSEVVGGDENINLGFVFFTDNTDFFGGGFDGIGRVDVDGTDLQQILNTDDVVPGDSDPFGISIDREENRIYYSDNDGGVQGIYRADLGFDGQVIPGTIELIVDTGFDPRGIEVVGDFLYWVDEDSSELHRILKDGSGPIEDLLDLPDSVSDLDDLAIDDVNGFVYFVDDGLDRVARYRLDGSGSIETIVQFTASNPGSPQSIALDVEGGKVYWTNAANDTIQRSNLDGSDLQTIASTGVGFPNGIALDLKNDFVYFADTSPGGGGVETIRRAFFGDLPDSGPVALLPTEVVSDTTGLLGVQNLNHLEVDVRTHLHASVNIVDTDSAVVFVSTDNTLAEASLNPASEPGTSPDDHQDIVISLRDAVGTPVTSQTGTLVEYLFDPSSTASNGGDFLFLDGDVIIDAGTSTATLESTPASAASVFVVDDSLLEGDETVIVTLENTSNPYITVVTPADPNYETDEDTGFVLIVDDESADISIEAIDDVAKEADGIDEPLNPGVFNIDLTQPSVTDTTVLLQVTTDAEVGDFSLSAPAANNLTALGGGLYSIVIPAGNFNPGAVITVNVTDDLIVEPNEFVQIAVVGTDNSAISIPAATAADSVTIFDDDVAKVIIENNGDATESTQPGTDPDFPLASPGEDGQFVVSLVNPFTGELVESETNTTVRVLLDPLSTASFGADFTIPGFVDIDPGPGVQYAGTVTFAGNGGIAGSAGADASEQFIDVELLAESAGSLTNPLDVGDETVKLTLDTSFGVFGDDRDFDGIDGPLGSGEFDPNDNDGVIGDLQIELDADVISFQFDEDNPWEDFTVDGMGMNMAVIDIIDETFKINITANDENAAEPGTEVGDSGQFTITIDNPFQFGDTIVNYVLTGTATTASEGVDIGVDPNTTNPQDFQDLAGFDPTNPAFISVSIEGQIVIPAGQDTAFLDVDVIDDNLLEALDPETVVVTLVGLDSELTSAVENSPAIADSTSVLTAFNRMLGTDLSATVNIFDDDVAVVTPSVSDGVAIEPDSPGDSGQFALTLSNPSATATTVRFTLSGDATLAPFGTAATATDQGDYVIQLNGGSASGGASLALFSGNTYDVTFAAGQDVVLIDLVTLDDFIIEDDETATLTVNGVVAGDPNISVSGSASITIEDTDVGELVLDVLDGIALENGAGALNEAAYVLRLVDQDDPSQRLVSDTATTVTFAVTGGTADLGADFDFGSLTTTVDIPAFTGVDPDFSLGADGEINIPVIALDDSIVELTETVEVTATGVAGDDDIVLSSSVTGVVSILDDDSATVSISSDVADGADPDAAETDPEGQNDGQFVVLLSEESSTDTTVRFEVDLSNTDAFIDEDFTLNGQGGPFPFGEVTIAAGDLSAPISLDVIDNLTQEDAEDVTIRLIPIPSTNGVIGDQDITIDGTADSATITIQDNDLPTFIVRNTTANEGDGTITFTIDLTQPIDVDVDVFLNLSNGTATGAADPLDASVSDQDFDNNDGGTVGTTATVRFPANGGGTAASPGTILTQTITVDINDDIFVELDEVFTAQLVIDGASTPNTLADGREVNILDDQDAGEAYGQALIIDNDTATFTITGVDDSDPTVDEGTNANPFANNAALTTVSFEITSSNPIDVAVPLTVTFGGGTANGADFDVDGPSTALQINELGGITFGTDFDSGAQTVTFNPGVTSQTIHVGVVQDNIVEGGPSSTLPSFGVETFVADIEASDAALGARAHVDTDDSTATIHDRDADDPTLDDGSPTVRGDDDDQAVITVVATDNEAAEPTDIPVFNNGVFTITQSNPSSTTTRVRFGLTGDAIPDGPGAGLDPDADFFLTAAVVGAPAVPVNLVNLGGGLFEVDIPGSPGNVEYTQVEITVNVIDDDVTGDADDGDGLLEDDEFVTLTLQEIVSGDPEVRLADELQSDTVQIDDDDEGLVSVQSDVSFGGDPDAAETTPEGQDDGRFVFFLRDNAGDLTASDTETVISFQVTLPNGGSPDTAPVNGQANPLNDFDFSSSDTFTFNPVTGLGTITIDAGDSSAQLDVDVLDDTLQELAEEVTLTIIDSISNPAGNADIDVDAAADSAVVTIAASDGLRIAITDTSDATEDDINGTFTFSLLDADDNLTSLTAGDTPGDAGIEVFFEIVITDPVTGDTITTADVGADFQFDNSVIFGVGEQTEILTVDVNEDLLVEGDELISIRITGLQFVQGASAAEVLLDGEEIGFDASIATTTIIDNDGGPVLPSGVFVRGSSSTAFSALVSDFADDGTIDGSSLGYEITSTETVPFTNANEIVLQFAGPVSIADFDFTLTGVGGFTPTGPGDVAGIDSVTLGPGNTIVISLDQALDASRMTLLVENGGTSQSYEFEVLPGDFNSDGAVNVFDTFAVAARGGTVLNSDGTVTGTAPNTYDLRADVNGDGSVNVFDLFAVAGLNGSTLPTPPSTVIFAGSSAASGSNTPSLDIGASSQNSVVIDGFSAASNVGTGLSDQDFAREDELQVPTTLDLSPALQLSGASEGGNEDALSSGQNDRSLESFNESETDQERLIDSVFEGDFEDDFGF